MNKRLGDKATMLRRLRNEVHIKESMKSITHFSLRELIVITTFIQTLKRLVKG